MEKNEKTYIYYVATLSRWELFPANDVEDALKAAEESDELHGKTILTVRIASKGEIGQIDSLNEWKAKHPGVSV